MENRTHGQIAYDGYFASCGGKSLISGAQLPTWEAQSEPIRAAWEAAAITVRANMRAELGLPFVDE